jgi:hypothetical protein
VLARRTRYSAFSVAGLALATLAVLLVRPDLPKSAGTVAGSGRVSQTVAGSGRVSLDDALATAFYSVEGIDTASQGPRHLVAVSGFDDRNARANSLRVFESDDSGTAEELPRPVRAISQHDPFTVARFGRQWCFAGKDASSAFVGACRQIGAPAGQAWQPLPTPPSTGRASYAITGDKRALWCAVTSRRDAVSATAIYTLAGGRWHRRGQVVTGTQQLVQVSTQAGRLVLTINKPVPPRVQVFELRSSGDRLLPLLSGPARRRISGLGYGPGDTGVVYIGDAGYLGLSQRADRRIRFGIASLSAGRFYPAPGRRGSQAQGGVFRSRGGGGWAIWRELRLNPAGRGLIAVTKAARVPHKARDWGVALRSARTIESGTYIAASFVVLTIGGRDYALVPHFTGRRLAYRRALLGISQSHGGPR